LTTTSTERPSLSVECLRYAAGTDIGRRREENQDNFGVLYGSDFRLYIVADGMGGAKGGAIASSLAVAAVRAEVKERNELTVDILQRAIENANEEINTRGSSDPRLSGMGTTLVGLGFSGKRLIVCNVGDSRAFLVKNNTIKQLTHDHTLVQEMVRAGSITPEQAESHPISHMLTRSLGPSAEVEVDCWEIDHYQKGDRYILCSDGLYNMVKDPEYTDILNKHGLDGGVQELIRLANERGGTDNITVIIIEVMDSPDLGSPEKIEQEIHEEEKAQVSPHSDTLRMERPTEELPQEQTSNTRKFGFPAILFVTILGAFVGGVLFGPSLFSGSDRNQNPVVAVEAPVAKATAVQVLPTKAPELPLEASKDQNIQAREEFVLTETEVAELNRRQETLSRTVDELDRKINATSGPLSGQLGERLKGIDDQHGKLTSQIAALKRDLDSEARKLSVWYERRKKLATADPINMATELAALSDDVRAKKEAFETKTWEYLKQVEQLRYEPDNKELDSKVANLVHQRGDAMKELTASVKDAVTQEVSTSEQTIAERTIKKNGLESELARLDDESAFLKRIVSLTPSEREAIKEDLTKERDGLSSDLAKVRERLAQQN
jgi:serine/threonine protein phosphatase PrpC